MQESGLGLLEHNEGKAISGSRLVEKEERNRNNLELGIKGGPGPQEMGCGVTVFLCGGCLCFFCSHVEILVFV